MVPQLSIKAKEAIKVALAFTLVYAIALRLDWMNPSWAGFAVAMVSLAPAGQSLHKGFLRIAGTIPGCIAALAILSLASQNRWGFVLLTSSWIFFTSYLMIVDKDRSYMWNVAGFVCLVILLTGPSSSENAFEHAIFRSVETVMGVLVYTLIAVFLWPRSNAGAITKACVNLVDTQTRLIRAARSVIIGSGAKCDFAKLHALELRQLGQLTQALQAEGSESYQVRELRPLWNRFRQLSETLMEVTDRLGTGFAQLSGIDAHALSPDLPAFFDELDHRFKHIQRVLSGESSSYEMQLRELRAETHELHRLPSLDRAALALGSKNLKSIELLSRQLCMCVNDIKGDSVVSGKPEPIPALPEKRHGLTLPVIDLDHLKGAAFAAFTVCAGFLVWVFVNPPGHAGWFEFSGIVAMAMAATPQMNPLAMGKSISLASALCLMAYIFIMPGLSSFAGLGTLLFILVFVNCYFFTGLARLGGMVAIINETAVQNQQSYDFAAMANSLIFIITAFVFLFFLSYLLSATRPEKSLLRLMRRYFRSVEYLVSRLASPASAETSGFRRWKNDFHRYEIKTLPEKIGSWGKAISPTLFPANSQAQVNALVTSLQVLSIRVETLFEAGEGALEHELTRVTEKELMPWLAKIEGAFNTWAEFPEAGTDAAGDLQARLEKALKRLEEHIDSALEQTDTGPANAVDSQCFFRLLGGLRGVSEASVAYAGTAGNINWAQWREEKFS